MTEIKLENNKVVISTTQDLNAFVNNAQQQLSIITRQLTALQNRQVSILNDLQKLISTENVPQTP
jgi:hypothetical protein